MKQITQIFLEVESPTLRAFKNESTMDVLLDSFVKVG